jgi:hypothetical protein
MRCAKLQNQSVGTPQETNGQIDFDSLVFPWKLRRRYVKKDELRNHLWSIKINDI